MIMPVRNAVNQRLAAKIAQWLVRCVDKRKQNTGTTPAQNIPPAADNAEKQAENSAQRG